MTHHAYRSFCERHAEEYAIRLDVLAQAMRDVSTMARDVVPSAVLHGRVKSALSSWLKLRRTRLAHGSALDSVGVRVIVPRTVDCYRVLECARSAYVVVPESDDDYVANPKSNGYRSLHTALVVPGGHTVELQVRTHWMHAIAEAGTASHRQYKHWSTRAGALLAHPWAP